MTNEEPLKKKPGPKSSKEIKDAFLADARKALTDALSHDKHNRDRILEELTFATVPGEQWDEQSKLDREGRLSLEFNQLPTFKNQITGAARKNQHSGKVHPESDDADPKVAEIIEGFIRRVESRSHAQIAYDTGRDHGVTGMGFWRIRTDYEHDNTFNQTVFIDAIPNRFSVVFGYSEEWHRQDAPCCFLLTTMDKEAFNAKYPKAEYPGEGFTADASFNNLWYPKERVTLAEYFCKEYYTEKIYQLPDGTVVKEIPDEYKDLWPDMLATETVREREINSYKIYRYLISSHEILEDKKLWPSKYWPIVPVDGEVTNINGTIYRTGIYTYAIDAQRALNFLLTTDIETASFSPKIPWLLEARQIEGFVPLWKTAHKNMYPFLLYKHIDGVPRPTREQPPSGAPNLLPSAMVHKDNMRLTTGVAGVSSLDRAEEKSGIAIQRRMQIGDTGTFHYHDNADRSIQLTWEIITDLIPTILDSYRKIQIEDLNGSIEEMEINKAVKDEATGEINILNDLSKGRYGVTISTGPSFDTQRQETAQFLMDLGKMYPQALPAISHIMVKKMDVAGAPEISKKLLTVAPLQTLTEKEKEEIKEYIGDQPPPPPDPKVLEIQAKMEENAKRLEMDLSKQRLEMEKIEAEIEKLRADGIKSLAQAEAAEIGTQLEHYRLQLDTLNSNVETMMKMQQEGPQMGQEGGEMQKQGMGQGVPGEMPGGAQGPI